MELENYINYLNAKGLSDRTIKEYVRYYRLFPIGTTDLESAIYYFLSQHNNRVARAFTVSYASFLKRRDVEIPKITGSKTKKVIYVLSNNEYLLLKKGMESKSRIYGLMYELQFKCGLRNNELFSISTENFRLTEWSDNIEMPCKLKISYEFAKRGKERIVLVPPDLMLKLYKFIKYIPKEQAIFRKGRHSYWKMLKGVSIKILGRSVNPHLLRHSRATALSNKGMPIIHIKNFLGHASISTTQIYINPSEEESLEKMEEYIMTEE